MMPHGVIRPQEMNWETVKATVNSTMFCWSDGDTFPVFYWACCDIESNRQIWYNYFLVHYIFIFRDENNKRYCVGSYSDAVFRTNITADNLGNSAAWNVWTKYFTLSSTKYLSGNTFANILRYSKRKHSNRTTWHYLYLHSLEYGISVVHACKDNVDVIQKTPSYPEIFSQLRLFLNVSNSLPRRNKVIGLWCVYRAADSMIFCLKIPKLVFSVD